MQLEELITLTAASLLSNSFRLCYDGQRGEIVHSVVGPTEQEADAAIETAHLVWQRTLNHEREREREGDD